MTMTRVRAGVLALAGLTLAACTDETRQSRFSGATRMTGAQMEELKGRTFYGPGTPDVRPVVHIGADGELRSRSFLPNGALLLDRGQAEIEGDLWCERWSVSREGRRSCLAVLREGGQVIFISQDIATRAVFVESRPGNPENL